MSKGGIMSKYLACEIAVHESFKRDEATWRANTIPLLGRDGQPFTIEEDDDGPYCREWALCRHCSSSTGRRLPVTAMPTMSAFGRLPRAASDYLLVTCESLGYFQHWLP